MQETEFQNAVIGQQKSITRMISDKTTASHETSTAELNDNDIEICDNSEPKQSKLDKELVQKPTYGVEPDFLDLIKNDCLRRSGPRLRSRNPFIAFFLSMYSRRPRRRAADVARQAARRWSRMSNQQRSHYGTLTTPRDKRRRGKR